MTRFRFVHASDLHLDTPFEGLSRVAAHVEQALIGASMDAFDRIVAKAIEVEAAFVLLAGDLYDGSDPSPRAQLHLHHGLEKLSREGICSFVVHGNHDPDPIGGMTAITTWPDEVKIFGTGAAESVPVLVDGENVATVHGVSLATEKVDFARVFARVEGPGLHIGLLHCNVVPDASVPSIVTPDALERVGCQYWALGHRHEHQEIVRDGCLIVYPGVPQGRQLRSTERGAKGAVLVEAEGDRILRLERFFTDSIRFLEVKVEIDELPDLAALRSLLSDEVARTRQDHDGKSLVIQGVLEGRGDLCEVLARPQALDGLLAELRDHQGKRMPFVWWAGLSDRTRPVIDFDQLAERGDFTGELIRHARGLEEDAEGLGKLLEGAAEGPGLDVARLLSDDGERREVFEEAIRLAVHLTLERQGE